MDLRDHFTVKCAATLAGAFSDPAQIARRAYDMAEALLAERARRIDADEARAIDDESALVAFDLLFDPDAVDPGLLEPPNDPTWDIDKPPLHARLRHRTRPHTARTRARPADQRRDGRGIDAAIGGVSGQGRLATSARADELERELLTPTR